MAKQQKTDVEIAQAELDSARNIMGRFERIEAVQAAAEKLATAKARAGK